MTGYSFGASSDHSYQLFYHYTIDTLVLGGLQDTVARILKLMSPVSGFL